mmetsp:Transcript_17707/g.33860  ORF Transcript_17707/g.33860 Transcript_17707/m.33860 type:complete len:186 (-) Transcript_17707:1695-2252(-)
MGKDKGKGGGKGKNSGGGGGKSGEFVTQLDVSGVRFTHSKIRPIFSDGRLLLDTLEEIESGKLNADTMNNITVIQQDGYYVSMNNRRLWVLKEAHKRGLLKNGTVQVRVQAPQDTKRLKDRFTMDKCSLSATFMREPKVKLDEASARTCSNAKNRDGFMTEDDQKQGVAQEKLEHEGNFEVVCEA